MLLHIVVEDCGSIDFLLHQKFLPSHDQNRSGCQQPSNRRSELLFVEPLKKLSSSQPSLARCLASPSLEVLQRPTLATGFWQIHTASVGFYERCTRTSQKLSRQRSKNDWKYHQHMQHMPCRHSAQCCMPARRILSFAAGPALRGLQQDTSRPDQCVG